MALLPTFAGSKQDIANKRANWRTGLQLARTVRRELRASKDGTSKTMHAIKMDRQLASLRGNQGAYKRLTRMLGYANRAQKAVQAATVRRAARAAATASPTAKRQAAARKAAATRAAQRMKAAKSQARGRSGGITGAGSSKSGSSTSAS